MPHGRTTVPEAPGALGSDGPRWAASSEHHHCSLGLAGAWEALATNNLPVLRQNFQAEKDGFRRLDSQLELKSEEAMSSLEVLLSSYSAFDPAGDVSDQ